MLELRRRLENATCRSRGVARVRSTISGGAPGQIIALFAFSVGAMVVVLGLIFDGGNLYVQRRTVQNAADAASFAGTRALMKATVQSDHSVADAVCMYLLANTFGVAPTGVATYVEIPTAATPTVIDLGTPKCSGVTAPNTSIPNNASGVTVDASINNFPTYVMGMLGIATMTAQAHATVQGAAVTQASASNAPFIVCGIGTFVAPAGAVHKDILTMSGGSPVLDGSGRGTIDANAVGTTFVIHAGSVADCGAGTSFKGVANTTANAAVASMPASLVYTAALGSSITASQVDGYQGCAAGSSAASASSSGCVMMVPVATLGGTATNQQCVVWAAFQMTYVAPGKHFGILLAGYSVGGAPESFTWTWINRQGAALTSLGLTK